MRWRMQRNAPGGLIWKGGTGQWSLWTWPWQRRFARTERGDQDPTRRLFLHDLLGTLNPQGSDLAEAFVQGTLTDARTLVVGDADSTRKM